MINFDADNLIPLTDVPKFLPTRNGRKLHRATVYRWALHGLRGVRLETTKIGGFRYTSVQAAQRFFQALSGHSGQGSSHAVEASLRPISSRDAPLNGDAIRAKIDTILRRPKATAVSST